MALPFEKAKKSCRAIARQVQDNVGMLNIHHILYHEGRQADALSMAGHAFAFHPAGKTALNLIKRPNDNDTSRILGTAAAQEKLLFGLVTRQSFLTLCALNIDRFDNIAEMRREAYHMAWKAVDTVRHSEQAEHIKKGKDEILVRKRNALQMARANLEADTFSALINHLQGDPEAITAIGRKRALDSLCNIPNHRSDLYPFPLVTEMVNFAVSKWQYSTMSPRRAFALAEKMTFNIISSIDDTAIKGWLIFSESAQDMAWRGFDHEEILSAAINTSDNTHIRSTAYLVSEITDIEPASIISAQRKYSAFCDDSFNAELHYNMMNKVFEDTIAKSIEKQSARPFIEEANRQNISLINGQTLGWCASALQDSAYTFEKALTDGYDPENATRHNFEERKNKTAWDDLKKLGTEIVKKNRVGDFLSLEDLSQFCKTRDDCRVPDLTQSIDFTLKDPGYNQQMAAINELDMMPAQPSAPAPTAAPKIAPPAPAPAAPGLGLGGGGRTRTTIPPQQSVTETDANAETTTAHE